MIIKSSRSTDTSPRRPPTPSDALWRHISIKSFSDVHSPIINQEVDQLDYQTRRFYSSAVVTAAAAEGEEKHQEEEEKEEVVVMVGSLWNPLYSFQTKEEGPSSKTYREKNNWIRLKRARLWAAMKTQWLEWFAARGADCCRFEWIFGVVGSYGEQGTGKGEGGRRGDSLLAECHKHLLSECAGHLFSSGVIVTAMIDWSWVV